MPNFDDPELRKQSDELHKKLQGIRKMMTPENKKLIGEKLDAITQGIIPLLEKRVLGTITEDEEEFLKEAEEKVKMIATGFSNAQAIVEESLTARAVAIYHHVKEKAEQGDPDAKKVYEKLRPLYQKMIDSEANDPERQN